MEKLNIEQNHKKLRWATSEIDRLNILLKCSCNMEQCNCSYRGALKAYVCLRRNN